MLFLPWWCHTVRFNWYCFNMVSVNQRISFFLELISFVFPSLSPANLKPIGRSCSVCPHSALTCTQSGASLTWLVLNYKPSLPRLMNFVASQFVSLQSAFGSYVLKQACTSCLGGALSCDSSGAALTWSVFN